MQVDLRSFGGNAAGSVELKDDIFGLEPRADILARMVRWQLAKRRAGTHKVKNRAEIWRTGKKLYKQKGTGQARAGSIRSPLWRGGGVTHAAQPRDYTQKVNKKMYRGAIRAIVSELNRTGNLIVAERHAKVTVVESFVGLTDAAYFTNAVTEVDIADGATVTHLKVQREGSAAYHVAHVEARQARDSHLVSFSFAVGGRLAKRRRDSRSSAGGLRPGAATRPTSRCTRCSRARPVLPGGSSPCHPAASTWPRSSSSSARARAFLRFQPSRLGTVATLVTMSWCGNSPTCWMT